MMLGTGAMVRDRNVAGRSEQDWCHGHRVQRGQLPQSQVWVGYPPESLVVEALAMMSTLAMMGTLPPAQPLAQAGLGVPRLVSVRTARLAKLRHVVAPWLPNPGLALGTIPGAACLSMGTFSTSVSTFPGLVGPEVLTSVLHGGGRDSLGSEDFGLSISPNVSLVFRYFFPWGENKVLRKQCVCLGRQGCGKILHFLY